MNDFAFTSIPVPERQAKPRTRGLSMMIDWGMGLGRQADTLDSAGLYIDNAKIAGPIPRDVVPILRSPRRASDSRSTCSFSAGRWRLS